MYKTIIGKLLIVKQFINRNLFHHSASYYSLSYIPNTKINNLNAKYNLDYKDIIKEEENNKEGVWTKNKVFVVNTGKFTGRSPNDKYIVSQEPSKNKIWWGSVNKPLSAKIFDELYQLCADHYNNNVNNYYIFDGYCGANKKTQKKIRFLTEYTWQHHFVKNMFIEALDTSVADFVPDMTIINACKVVNKKWKEHDLNSENFVAFNIEKKLGLIGGTHYGGEMKKGIFSMMNYWLPQKNILPMHCSANINQYNDTTLFFGLSGTGKTTLSTDVSTNIIGDDEHGWGDDGIFNFEGGCYAKTNGLSQKSEPLIYNAIKTNALLENVVMNESMVPNYNDISKTENGRVSYPLSHIPNRVITSKGSHPKNIIFLTCDRYGVLPSVAKLTKEQAIYYFLSGYTSKVSGTERGVTEPEATFSPCFGGAFLTLPPEKYGSILYQKLQKYNCNVYLVNTGWSGTGKRFSIEKTRKIIHDIMSGDIAKNVFETDPIFHFTHPISENPKNSWKDKREFERKRWNLARMFRENFEKNNYSTDLQKYGP